MSVLPQNFDPKLLTIDKKGFGRNGYGSISGYLKYGGRDFSFYLGDCMMFIKDGTEYKSKATDAAAAASKGAPQQPAAAAVPDAPTKSDPGSSSDSDAKKFVMTARPIGNAIGLSSDLIDKISTRIAELAAEHHDSWTYILDDIPPSMQDPLHLKAFVKKPIRKKGRTKENTVKYPELAYALNIPYGFTKNAQGKMVRDTSIFKGIRPDAPLFVDIAEPLEDIGVDPSNIKEKIPYGTVGDVIARLPMVTIGLSGNLPTIYMSCEVAKVRVKKLGDPTITVPHNDEGEDIYDDFEAIDRSMQAACAPQNTEIEDLSFVAGPEKQDLSLKRKLEEVKTDDFSSQASQPVKKQQPSEIVVQLST